MLDVYNYITANTIIPTALELIEYGWVPLLKTGVVSIATTGQLVWTSDSVGRKAIVEQNSSAIKSDIENSDVLAAIIEAGGTPATSSYPQGSVRVVGTIAGGAGQFPAATAIAAVAGKQIFLEELSLFLSSNTASAGVVITLNDGAGGTLTYDCGVSVNQVHTVFRPNKIFTAATLVEWVGTPGAFTNCDNGDYVLAYFKFREI